MRLFVLLLSLPQLSTVLQAFTVNPDSATDATLEHPASTDEWPTPQTLSSDLDTALNTLHSDLTTGFRLVKQKTDELKQLLFQTPLNGELTEGDMLVSGKINTAHINSAVNEVPINSASDEEPQFDQPDDDSEQHNHSETLLRLQLQQQFYNHNSSTPIGDFISHTLDPWHNSTEWQQPIDQFNLNDPNITTTPPSNNETMIDYILQQPPQARFPILQNTTSTNTTNNSNNFDDDWSNEIELPSELELHNQVDGPHRNHDNDRWMEREEQPERWRQRQLQRLLEEEPILPDPEDQTEDEKQLARQLKQKRLKLQRQKLLRQRVLDYTTQQSHRKRMNQYSLQHNQLTAKQRLRLQRLKQLQRRQRLQQQQNNDQRQFYQYDHPAYLNAQSNTRKAQRQQQTDDNLNDEWNEEQQKELQPLTDDEMIQAEQIDEVKDNKSSRAPDNEKSIDTDFSMNLSQQHHSATLIPLEHMGLHSFARHNTPTDCYLLINSTIIYDLNLALSINNIDTEQALTDPVLKPLFALCGKSEVKWEELLTVNEDVELLLEGAAIGELQTVVKHMKQGHTRDHAKRDSNNSKDSSSEHPSLFHRFYSHPYQSLKHLVKRMYEGLKHGLSKSADEAEHEARKGTQGTELIVGDTYGLSKRLIEDSYDGTKRVVKQSADEARRKNEIKQQQHNQTF